MPKDNCGKSDKTHRWCVMTRTRGQVSRKNGAKRSKRQRASGKKDMQWRHLARDRFIDYLRRVLSQLRSLHVSELLIGDAHGGLACIAKIDGVEHDTKMRAVPPATLNRMVKYLKRIARMGSSAQKAAIPSADETERSIQEEAASKYGPQAGTPEKTLESALAGC